MITTVANSPCPPDDGWQLATVFLALIAAITLYKIIKLWLPPRDDGEG